VPLTNGKQKANTPMNLAPLVTFAVYTIIAIFWKNESLLTAQAFTSIALVSLLTTPVVVFIQALPRVVQCIGCFDRIQEYYGHGGLTAGSDFGTLGNNGSADFELATGPQKQSISFTGQSFSWSKSGTPVLRNLDFLSRTGTVTAIVGPVGSGKSTFLESILGETISTSGQAFNKYTGSVAYCSQQPWLENKTIRQNIIGVSPFDDDWYQNVLQACGLQSDLRTLKLGDQTRVGSKGLNLSGGQKQRVVSKTLCVCSLREVINFDLIYLAGSGTSCLFSSKCGAS
jgi:ABC-type multidrug transport system fused ATPase/permease subunit